MLWGPHNDPGSSTTQVRSCALSPFNRKRPSLTHPAVSRVQHLVAQLCLPVLKCPLLGERRDRFTKGLLPVQHELCSPFLSRENPLRCSVPISPKEEAVMCSTNQYENMLLILSVWTWTHAFHFVPLHWSAPSMDESWLADSTSSRLPEREVPMPAPTPAPENTVTGVFSAWWDKHWKHHLLSSWAHDFPAASSSSFSRYALVSQMGWNVFAVQSWLSQMKANTSSC